MGGRTRAELSGHHIAIDGKALRGTRDGAAGKCLVHVVRPWVDAHALSAGQVTCAEKSNEPERSGDRQPQADRRVERSDIKSKPSRACSTLCKSREQSSPLMPPALSAPSPKKIHEAGAGYVLSLKANHKNTLAAVAEFFASAPRAAP